jgi:ribonucleotide reductase alpha subunit
MDAHKLASFDVDAFRRKVLSDPLVQNVWENKYRWKRPDGFTEESIEASKRRVVEAIYANDPDKKALDDALDAVLNGYFLPAGRVNAGAGTGRNVTLMNCYVSGTIQDSMSGIQHSIAKDAFTLQQGGGVGADFSTVRPNGAIVSRTGSVASGSIAFMEQRSAMSATVCSAGERRGALMTTLRCDHPDLWNEDQFETTTTYTGEKVLKNPSFISVKRQPGRLTQTNISILVTDDFMKAVEDDADWDLGFFAPRADGKHVEVYDKPFPYDVVEMDNDFVRDTEGAFPRKGEMLPWYVYRRVKARRIWNDIMRSTYKFAEPGVIFIDHVNARNNLNYCEDIQCTNPCFGEGTLIVTSKGARPIESLIGETVEIHDGHMWRIIDSFRVTGKNQPMLRLTMQDGSTLRVTRAHTMILEDGRRVEARDIRSGSRLMLSSFAYKNAGLVVSVEDDGVDEEVYCCTVPETHSIALGIGIVTGQCSEQPLPPFGCCDLGSVNLAFMVRDPFTPMAQFDLGLLTRTVTIGIRFLDNVLDVSNYPLREQREESMRKRRIGLGVTGVADALLQLGIRYGTQQAQDMVRGWMHAVQVASYRASMNLAKSRGPFPLFDSAAFMDSPNVKALPHTLKREIADVGIRNGVLNTVAPNGTISIYSGNVSSGIEPVFSFDKVTRKVRQPDGTLAPYESVDYAYRLYEAIHGPTKREDLPNYFVGAMDVAPEEHVKMLAACQEYVDSSISKTVNCPTDMSFEAFQDIYAQAYTLGCKGCTTYRFDPDSGRGAVLTVDEPKASAAPESAPATGYAVAPRDRILHGRTYKLKWPPSGRNWYVIINHTEAGIPSEVFITGGEEGHVEWIQAMGRLLTAVLRRGGDVRFLVNELMAVHAAGAGGFIAEQHAYRPSIVAAIGGILEEEFKALGLFSVPAGVSVVKVEVHGLGGAGGGDSQSLGTECPQCHSMSLVHEDGCKRCLTCDYTKCG